MNDDVEKSPEKVAEPGAPGLFEPGGPQGPGRGPAKGAPNAGRPKSSVRAAALLSFEQRLWVLEAIADGLLTTQVLVGKGDDRRLLEIPPTIDERRKAVVDLGNMAGVPRLELDLGGEDDDSPAKYGLIFMPMPDPKPVPPGYARCPDCGEAFKVEPGAVHACRRPGADPT